MCRHSTDGTSCTIYAHTDLKLIRWQRVQSCPCNGLGATSRSIRAHYNMNASPALGPPRIQFAFAEYRSLSFKHPQPIMIAPNFLYLPLLLALAQAISVPTCMAPPPPRQFLPHLSDCLLLSLYISHISTSQGDLPQIWSRAPAVPGLGVKLPHIFALPDNDCEVFVDTVYGGAADLFPTRRIADVTGILTSECLAGNSRGRSTLGHMLVDPNQKIIVILRKGYRSPIITGKNNTAVAFNGTELAEIKVAVDSGANITSPALDS